MREILFRGKRVDNGEIIESDSILQISGKNPLLWFASDGWIEVIPDTVGQFTGLTDKNGKKIFEGDIVRFSHDAYDEDFIGEVIFDEYESCFTLKYGDGWVVFSYIGECYEVIGNIHDNTELLEVG